MIDDVKRRIDEPGFYESRALCMTNESSLEGKLISLDSSIWKIEELALAYEEIKKNEKDLKGIH
jgi:hypothetical protein